MTQCMNSFNHSPVFFFISLFIAALLVFPLSSEAQNKEADTAAAPDVLSQFGSAMAKITEKVRPAVVNISTSKTIKTQKHPFSDDPVFRRFFGEGPTGPQKRKATNLGSGVIAAPDGVIITCNHVIDGAEDILVKLPDNREYKGKVVGTDSRTDIAIIKIEEKNLPTIPWADSDKLRVGEVVIAIGQPYGLKHTITMGIISALGRAGLGITDYEDFIQTDAAINPGNSGGALVNTKGELIGMNNAIFSTSGGYQGIGFAIPSNMIRNVMESIVDSGKVVRGWLGVQIQPLTPELTKQFDLKDEAGVLLSDIVEGSPAEKAGLKSGDVILEFDGKRVESPFQLKNIVASIRPGKTVPVKVIRDGAPLSLNVAVGELPTDSQQATAAPSKTDAYDNALKGVVVQDITEKMMKERGITRNVKGVVVTDIRDDSPAVTVLAKGDIISDINKKPVASVKEYNAIVTKIPKGQKITLRIYRGNSYQYLVISGE